MERQQLQEQEDPHKVLQKEVDVVDVLVVSVEIRVGLDVAEDLLNDSCGEGLEISDAA